MDTGNSLTSWSRVVQASDFYEVLGYAYYPVDWAVSASAMGTTFKGNSPELSKNKYLVGSAEQSFIQDLDVLPPGKFLYGISPCFRPEDAGRSLYHRAYFLKLVLFYKAETEYECLSALSILKRHAWSFFSGMHAGARLACSGDGTSDIEINGIEVGSYGVRRQGQHVFCYGTGIAEPCLSLALGESTCTK